MIIYPPVHLAYQRIELTCFHRSWGSWIFPVKKSNHLLVSGLYTLIGVSLDNGVAQRKRQTLGGIRHYRATVRSFKPEHRSVRFLSINGADNANTCTTARGSNVPAVQASWKPSDVSTNEELCDQVHQPVRRGPTYMAVLRDAEVGSPASELSPYYQASVPMPSLEQVDQAIRTIRKEQVKMRYLTNILGIVGILIVIGMCARESDNALWLIIARLCTNYLSPNATRIIILQLARWDKLPSDTRVDDPFMKMTLCSLRFPNPVGLSAGFDVAAERPEAFLKMGYGFVEVGTITPFPETTQAASERDNVTYLSEGKGLVRRSDSASTGLLTAVKNLARFSKVRWQHDLSRLGVLGVNIGQNYNSKHPIWDFVTVARNVAPYADYLVLNLASGGRRFYEKKNLHELIKGVQGALDEMIYDVEAQKASVLSRLRATGAPGLPPDDADFNFALPNLTGNRCPLFIKFGSDVTEEELKNITDVVVELGVDGMVVHGNRTATRLLESSADDNENSSSQGIVSGKPLTKHTSCCVREVYRMTHGKVPIIASGGIFTGEDALEHIEAGASAVQLYSAMVYEGPRIARHVKSQLATLMYNKEYHALQDAVGAVGRKSGDSKVSRRKVVAPRFLD